MSEYIELLKFNHAQRAQFTVDTAKNYVPVAAHAASTLYNANNQNIFAKCDNFTILSHGLVFPLGFSSTIVTPVDAFDDNCVIGLSTKGVVSGRVIGLPAIGYGQILLPFSDYEMSIGLYCDCTGVTTIAGVAETFYLRAQISNLYVSMSQVDTALNGKVFDINYFIKIIHNTPLTV
jgi:hypothetical protein